VRNGGICGGLDCPTIERKGKRFRLQWEEEKPTDRCSLIPGAGQRFKGERACKRLQKGKGGAIDKPTKQLIRSKKEIYSQPSSGGKRKGQGRGKTTLR